MKNGKTNRHNGIVELMKQKDEKNSRKRIHRLPEIKTHVKNEYERYVMCIHVYVIYAIYRKFFLHIEKERNPN